MSMYNIGSKGLDQAHQSLCRLAGPDRLHGQVCAPHARDLVVMPCELVDFISTRDQKLGLRLDDRVLAASLLVRGVHD